MATNIDISSNADFVRLTKLQLAQAQELNEFKTVALDSITKLSGQIREFISHGRTDIPEEPDPCPPKSNFNDQKYLSLVDLDNPDYARCVLDDENFTPPKHIKVTMPRFDGSDVESWLYEVRRFFIVFKTPENQKLLWVSFHLDGMARKWFSWMEASGFLSTWKAFVVAVNKKFNNTQYTLPGGKLSKLTQSITVNAYIDEFEELSTRCLGLPEYFILETFISGLREDIRKEVVKSRPVDIQEASDIALLVEGCDSLKSGGIKTNFGGNKTSWNFGKSSTGTIYKPAAAPTTNVVKSIDTQKAPIFKKLSFEERAQRRKQGLCFNCEEKFVPGHLKSCKGKLFSLSADGSCLIEIDNDDMYPEEEDVVDEVEEIVSEEIPSGISMHAMRGQMSPDTLRLEGKIENKTVSILVDCGSTHNFMQMKVAKKMNLLIHPIKAFHVNTGSSTKLVCNKACKQVEILIQGTKVTMDIFLIEMAGTNVVIGIQWLSTLGDIISNYEKLYMKFRWEDKWVCWQGISWVSDEPLTRGELRCLRAITEEAFLCYFETNVSDSAEARVSEEIPQIHEVVQSYAEIFTEPNGLPPQRERDHVIHLEPGAKPANVRPYRYPQFQKNEIEKLVSEMLRQKTIKPSSSPFSSPVVLINCKYSKVFCV